jgi:malate dehydrogenase (oxaloacetate-decarboxylating)
MLLRAAKAIADTVSAEELHPAFIIPSVFHPDVTKRVASAISGREG